MKRRKHRIVVEATFSQAVTEKDAALALGLITDKLIPLPVGPIWDNADETFCEKLVFKQFSRVTQAAETTRQHAEWAAQHKLSRRKR